MMSKTDFDIAVIGGGPAGSVAAMMLAKAGFSVVLFERSAFPREVLCGEFISKEFIALLKEQNLLGRFNSLKPVTIDKLNIIDSSGKSLVTELGFCAYGLRRSVLDHFLLNEAKDCGAIIHQPASVVEIFQNDKLCTLSVKMNNEVISFKSRYVIAAYGKHNILDKHSNRKFVHNKSKLTGIKFHIPAIKLNDMADSEIRIYTTDNIYCGVNNVDSGISTICFLANQEGSSLRPFQHLHKLAEVNPEFGQLIHYLDEKSDFPVIKGAGNIYFGRRSLSDKRIFYAGDAAGMIAPLTGDGISIAGESGKVISEVLEKNYNTNVEQIAAAYSAEWARKFTKRRVYGRLIQTIFLSNIFRIPALSIASSFPRVVPFLISSTRG